MFKQLMMVLVVVFSMAMFVNAQDEVKDVTENIKVASNDVQDATAVDKAAEIAEINAEEKAKEKQVEGVDKKLEKTTEDATDAVKKEMAEDEALGEAEAAEATEPEVAEEKGSSWFGWLWPFGGEDDGDAVVAEIAVEDPADKEAVVEEVVEAAPEVEEKPVAPVKEPEVVEEIAAEEPEVAVEAADEEGSSWFAWLWPFGGDEEVVVAEESDEVPVEAPVEEEVAVVEEAPAEEPEVAEEPLAEEPQVAEDAAPAEEGEGIDFVHKIVYYIPNVMLDFSDTFSLALGVGAESGLRVGATRWCQFGGNYGDTYFLEKGYKRKIGGGYNDGYIGQLGPLTIEKRYVDETIGNLPGYILKNDTVYIPRPTDAIYKEEVRDFWEIGVEGGWLIKFDFQLHPVEIADFFTGIFFYDLCDDDL
jgi:hypothetical protein